MRRKLTLHIPMRKIVAQSVVPILAVFLMMAFGFGKLLFSESTDDKLETLKVDQRLTWIEKKMVTLVDNEKKIKTSHDQLKTELDNLGVWMRR